MKVLRAMALMFTLIGIPACAELNQQRGITDVVLDKVMLADSKKMDLLRAEVAMMFLSYAAVDAGERSVSESVGAIVALNRTARTIDCIRSSIDAAIAQRIQGEGCAPVSGLYFFDTRMVSVDRDLISLARTSLPNSSLLKLLQALPNGAAQPLSLISPILGVAQDAVLLGQRGFAVYRDAVEIVVEVYCGGMPPQPVSTQSPATATCPKSDVNDGREVEKQRKFIMETIAFNPYRLSMAPDSRHFAAARALTDANCHRLQDRVKAAGDKDGVKCRSSASQP